MNSSLKLVWHFGGLAWFVTGAAMLAGRPGAMMAIGLWAMAATAYDSAMGR